MFLTWIGCLRCLENVNKNNIFFQMVRFDGDLLYVETTTSPTKHIQNKFPKFFKSWPHLDSRFDWSFHGLSDLHFGNHFKFLWRSWFIYIVSYGIQVSSCETCFLLILQTALWVLTFTLTVVFIQYSMVAHNQQMQHRSPGDWLHEAWIRRACIGVQIWITIPQNTWVFPKIEVPQNGWFIMEWKTLLKLDDLGGKPTI